MAEVTATCDGGAEIVAPNQPISPTSFFRIHLIFSFPQYAFSKLKHFVSDCITQNASCKLSALSSKPTVTLCNSQCREKIFLESSCLLWVRGAKGICC